jgi:hypothetical protein
VTDDIDEAPDWMMDDDESDDEALSDKNSLGAILTEALQEVSEIGGSERAKLASLVGRKTYDALMERSSTRNAIQNWLDASPKTKPAATRMLALQIAKHTDASLAPRIEREINEEFEIQTRRAATASERETYHKAREQRRNGQRVSYQAPKGTDLHTLAKMADSRKYIEARRRQQKER